MMIMGGKLTKMSKKSAKSNREVLGLQNSYPETSYTASFDRLVTCH